VPDSTATYFIVGWQPVDGVGTDEAAQIDESIHKALEDYTYALTLARLAVVRQGAPGEFAQLFSVISYIRKAVHPLRFDYVVTPSINASQRWGGSLPEGSSWDAVRAITNARREDDSRD
jgi:hypothetical protein